jgi:DtxR family Mn-dependent transcriptional regulator
VCDILRRKTIEDYVELLYDLQKGNKRVHTNDIASALNINPASVTEILQKLSHEGYINYEKYSGATLTNKGIKIAMETKRRHDTLTEFLLLLGIDKKTANMDACEMEHILHQKTMDTIIKFVEVVKQCDVTPFWLERLKRYIKTGKLSKCPSELAEACQNYDKSIN